MQDQRPRWVAAADLRGSQRAVSAAKLLNVALTRAKERIYIIGDWSFVSAYHTTGMRALADLLSEPGFTLVRPVD